MDFTAAAAIAGDAELLILFVSRVSANHEAPLFVESLMVYLVVAVARVLPGNVDRAARGRDSRIGRKAGGVRQARVSAPGRAGVDRALVVYLFVAVAKVPPRSRGPTPRKPPPKGVVEIQVSLDRRVCCPRSLRRRSSACSRSRNCHRGSPSRPGGPRFRSLLCWGTLLRCPRLTAA